MASDKQVGAFTPSTAKIIADVVRYLRANGFIVDRGRASSFIPPTGPVHVKNTSGEEIPAYACMQAVGTLEKGGQNYVEVNKPADVDGASGWYLFNGIAPIEADGFGIGHDGPFVRMLTDGSSVNAGDKWQPTVGAWTIELGGELFIAAGDDDIETNVMRGFIVGVGAGLGSLTGVVTGTGTATSGDFNGLNWADVTVIEATSKALIGTTQRIYDRKGCIFDIDVTDYCVWAHELWASPMGTGKACDDYVKYWSADDRCCDANTAIYRSCT